LCFVSLSAYTYNIPQNTTDVNTYFNKNENSCKSLFFLLLGRAYNSDFCPGIATNVCGTPAVLALQNGMATAVV
jgi:hypothetical protein